MNTALFQLLHYTQSRQISNKKVPLITQTSNWDCGLACVLMTLLVSVDTGKYTLSQLIELCQTKSIWTIDLAYLLKRLNRCFLFLTAQIGANPDFSSVPYYARHIDEDQVRVNKLFAQASSEDITITQATLHLADLKTLCLIPNCLIIILINQKTLHFFTWGLYSMNMDLGSGKQLGYQGHYIVLTGYDETKRSFLVNDPMKSEPCWIPDFALEAARKSYGTDEDMLILLTEFSNIGTV